MPISTDAKPCFICHGDKLIPVPGDTGIRYLGCPACKTDKQDVIGEGFTLTDPADSPAIDALADDIIEDDRAHLMAGRYELQYAGRQEGAHGRRYLTFHDLQTGSTLMVTDLCLLPFRVEASRRAFAEASRD